MILVLFLLPDLDPKTWSHSYLTGLVWVGLGWFGLVWVGLLSYSLLSASAFNELKLREIFSPFGNVKSCVDHRWLRV